MSHRNTFPNPTKSTTDQTSSEFCQETSLSSGGNRRAPTQEGSGEFPPPLGTYCGLVLPFSDTQQKQALVKAIPGDHESFIERYRLQNIFRHLQTDSRFATDETKSLIKQGKPPRICHCLRTLSDGKLLVDLKHSKGAKRGHYGNLQTCGSAYACPICSGKISEYRAREITRACELWIEDGKNLNQNHTFVMITFTIPHYIFQSLHDVKKRFMRAKRELKQQKKLKRKPEIEAFKDLKDKYGIHFDITSMDYTWSGLNGWHVHSHDLFFVDRQLTEEEIEQLQKAIYLAWIHNCEKKSVGIRVDDKTRHYMKKHSIKVEKAPTPADYIAKFGTEVYEKHRQMFNQNWSSSQELTKSNYKRGRNNSMTPWDFARIIDRSKGNPEIYEFFGSLLMEFINEMKNKKMIFWGKGAKEYFEIEEVKDEQITSLNEEEEEIVYKLEPNEWKVVKIAKQRAELAILAARRDNIAVKQYIGLLWEKIQRKKLIGNCT